MKGIYLLIALSFIVSVNKVLAQYLTNGDFETFNSAAADPTRIQHASGWTDDVGYEQHSSGTPLTGSADHYYSSPATGATIFSSDPRGGQGHAGIVLKSENGNAAYREFIKRQTLSLTAGTTYLVEFWVRKVDGTLPSQVGAYVSASDVEYASNGIQSTITPVCNATLTNPSTEYQLVSGCFTAQVTGTHYIVLGNFGYNGDAGNDLNYVFIDDVSITAAPSVPDPTAIFSLNGGPVYCEGDPILASAGASNGFDSYKWICTSSSGAQIRGMQWEYTNSIPDLDVVSFVNQNGSNFPFQPGECYNLTLLLRNACQQSSQTIQFCIDDPSVSIIFDGQPVCEGQSFDLEVTGDNGWTYSWSNGQSGVGLREITETATPNVTQYTVTVTTPAGCQSTETVNIVVHTNNNTPPFYSGIDGGIEFTAYVNAGDDLTFSYWVADSPNENVFLGSNGLPSGSTLTPINGNAAQGIFQWNNIPDNAEGLYTFNATSNDNNACGVLSALQTYKIKVVCEDCPIEVYYENRMPNNSPLPETTIAGYRIVAGESVDPNQTDGPVETGSDFVEFRAPAIDLMPGFTGGANFDAIIDMGTCLQDCESFCCDQFSGFSYDTPFGNVVAPIHPTNPVIWYLRDEDNPFCAFGGATKYRIEVFQDQDLIYTREEEPQGCCPFESPSPSNPIPYSSIYWDGTDNSFLGGNNLVASGDYVIYIKLWSPCGDELTLSPIPVYVYGYNSGMILADGQDGYSETLAEIYQDRQQGEVEQGGSPLTSKEVQDYIQVREIKVFPNPTSDKFQLLGVIVGDQVELLDVVGKQLYKKVCSNGLMEFDLSLQPSGTYFVKITSNQGAATTVKIIKE
ncbi:T9SS type A sorting domain-containing protein [Parvicella tangerina]|uniref:Secretion system C-terminal sorting domain-containing protein n=1 Tax=Parvicella tangerina TaxID=2829795 RepID=A0A916NC39_9FLAO|nr:T9SS type A sorting domain-containing protein [Parvicella tangerina]CAG5082296.1 hypothetical protein CRYO30217_01869 [Parvicella tangerina]